MRDSSGSSFPSFDLLNVRFGGIISSLSKLLCPSTASSTGEEGVIENENDVCDCTGWEMLHWPTIVRPLSCIFSIELRNLTSDS